MKINEQLKSFQCEFCHTEFLITDFQSPDHARQACLKHELSCKGTPKIEIGDVVIFNDFNNLTKENQDPFFQTPPLFIKHIDRSQEIKKYHCVFTLIDLPNMTWMEDKISTYNWFKNSTVKYFVFNQLQINRKINMNDLLQVYKFLNDQKILYEGKSEYSDRNITTSLKPNFKQNRFSLTINIPFKTLQ